MVSGAKAAQLFPVMFQDSDIAKQFKMRKDKNSYVVTFGLGPYFQDQFIEATKVLILYNIF